jgi:hypothetical protein
MDKGTFLTKHSRHDIWTSNVGSIEILEVLVAKMADEAQLTMAVVKGWALEEAR